MSSTENNGILQPSNKRKNWFYAGFIIINLLLSCYYLDVWITPNTASRAVPVYTLYNDNSLSIDNYEKKVVDVSKINGHVYSNKAPLPTFLVYPYYLAYRGLGFHDLKEEKLKEYPIYIYENIKPNYDGRSNLLPETSAILIIGDILCGAVPFVIILLLSLFAVKNASLKISPVLLVMFAFYGSFMFAYSGAYTSHILAGMFALASYILIKQKKYVFSGIMIGFAMATEFPIAVLIPLWAILIYLNQNTVDSFSKKLSKPVLFGLGVLPGLLIVLYYNYHLTGSFFKTPYSYETHQQHKQGSEDVGFYYPSLSAFVGLVFSTYRGVLIYAPILIFMFWYALKNGYRNLSEKAGDKLAWLKSGMKNYLLMTILTYLLLYSAYYEWDGGWSYGPRYLIPVLVIVLYEGVVYLSSKSFSAYVFYGIATIGLLVTWMDKSTKIFELPNNPALYGNPVSSIIFPDFFKHKFNANTLPVFLFDSNPVIAIYAWPVLFVASLVFLAFWYSKLYGEKKALLKVLMPAIPFTVLFMAIVLIPGKVGVAKLSMYETGIFGSWKHFDLGNYYTKEAEKSASPDIKAQNYTQAAVEFEQVVKSMPGVEDYYIYLGDAYCSAGYQDNALTEYKGLIKVNPKASMAEKRVAAIYSGLQLYDSAMNYLKMSYKADSNLQALIDIGAVYQHEGNIALAMHYDSLVLKRDPNNKEALNSMSAIYNSKLK